MTVSTNGLPIHWIDIFLSNTTVESMICKFHDIQINKKFDPAFTLKSRAYFPKNGRLFNMQRRYKQTNRTLSIYIVFVLTLRSLKLNRRSNNKNKYKRDLAI